MYYASYDSSGSITGFYNDEIHSSIPILAKQLTDTEWKDCVENQGLRKINVATKELIKELILPFVPTPNWKAFRNMMLADTGYESATNLTAKVRGLARLENELMLASINQSSREVIKKYWDEVISGVTIKPSASRLAIWNTAATEANLDIRFAADGKMVLI